MKRSGPASKFKRTNFPKYARAANVIGAAYKAYRNRKRGNPSPPSHQKATGISGVTTFQKDVKQVYRYKRAPPRLRSKWQRSRRTFISNLLKQEASRKYHYHGAKAWTTGVNAQYWYGWSQYGVNGGGGYDGTGDLGDIFTRLDSELRLNGTVAENSERGENARRFYFDHMRSRCVLTNTGTTPIFWEIYECVARKDIPITPEGGTMLQFFQTSQGAPVNGSLSNVGPGFPAGVDTAKLISTSTLPTISSPGITPFQLRHFCQNFKILKTTRLQAAPGNTVSFDSSDARNLVVNWDNYLDLLAKKGITKFFVVRQWGAVTADAPNNSASSAVFEIERDYNVKTLSSQTPQLNYMTYTNIV